MYCSIKYKEFDENTQDLVVMNVLKKSNSTIKSTASKISQQENKTLIINPDCYIQILVDYICSVINFDKNSNFDFCDETGQLLNIKKLQPWMSAKTVMEIQKTYFVVLYKHDFAQYKSLEPILHSNSKEYIELMTKLKKYISSARRLSTEMRTRKKSAENTTSRTSSLRISSSKRSPSRNNAMKNLQKLK